MFPGGPLTSRKPKTRAGVSQPRSDGWVASQDAMTHTICIGHTHVCCCGGICPTRESRFLPLHLTSSPSHTPFGHNGACVEPCHPFSSISRTTLRKPIHTCCCRLVGRLAVHRVVLAYRGWSAADSPALNSTLLDAIIKDKAYHIFTMAPFV